VTPEPVSRSRANYALFLLVLVYVFNFIDRNLLTMLVGPIKQEFGVSDKAMGFLIGPAFAILYTFAGIPIARLADRSSRRSVIATGVALWSLMTAASGRVTGFGQLAAARIGVGIGEACATPSAHSLISDFYPPQRRTTALGIYNVGASLGILFGLAAGGFLREQIGWRHAFMVVGLPGLIVALIVRFSMTEPPRGASEARRDTGELPRMQDAVLQLGRSTTFRHVAMTAGLYSMTGYGVTTWAPEFMSRVHALPPTELGVALGLALGLGGAVGSAAGGWLCDRMAARDIRWLMWIPTFSGVAMVPCIAAFALQQQASASLLWFIPTALLNIVYANPVYAVTQGLADLRMRSLASAIILFVINLVGMGLGPQLVGVLNDGLAPRFGEQAIRYSFLFLGLFNLWGAVHCFLSTRLLREELREMR
jgi:predicted MFS family arabinose efflux permease